MELPIDREKKVILLRWLKEGVINTNDMPELKTKTFADYLMESSMIDTKGLSTATRQPNLSNEADLSKK